MNHTVLKGKTSSHIQEKFPKYHFKLTLTG